MTRPLPGVYTSLFDLSTIPEGQRSLVTGGVLKANRGPVGEATLVVSPLDFLTKFTFTGSPSPTDDPMYHSIIRILKETNQFYVSRASNGALYGGAVVKEATNLGTLTGAVASTKTLTFTGDVASKFTTNLKFQLAGTSVIDGIYTVVSATTASNITSVVVAETVTVDYTGVGTAFTVAPPTPLTGVKIAEVTTITKATKTIVVAGDMLAFFPQGDLITVKDTTGNVNYTVASASFDSDADTTSVIVLETPSTDSSTGAVYRNSIVDPESYEFQEGDLFLITGTDPGAYNGQFSFNIVSWNDSPDSLAQANTMQITFYNTATNAVVDSPFLCSRDESAKAIDGTPLFIEDVVNNSAYVKVFNNSAVAGTILPNSTTTNAYTGGGSNGVAVTDSDMIKALEVFADKTIPISLLANGSAETVNFQQAMMALSNTRLDILTFLNSRLVDEKATLNSQKALNIVNYKKNTLANTSFYGCMYAPHVQAPDIFNSREVTLGAADAVAIPGWLNIVRTKGYPYAYAGPADGLVQGVTTKWKIGDMSGEASILNDASVNLIGFDGKVGRYYIPTQNTLQVANSSLRNIGAVLNVLDIKETFAIYFKEFLQKPITTGLRQQILNTGRDYMNTIVSAERVTNYSLIDATTDLDMSDNTLRYVLTLALTPYSQKIYLVINVVNQTFDFSILQSV